MGSTITITRYIPVARCEDSTVLTQFAATSDGRGSARDVGGGGGNPVRLDGVRAAAPLHDGNPAACNKERWMRGFGSRRRRPRWLWRRGTDSSVAVVDRDGYVVVMMMAVERGGYVAATGGGLRRR